MKYKVYQGCRELKPVLLCEADSPEGAVDKARITLPPLHKHEHFYAVPSEGSPAATQRALIDRWKCLRQRGEAVLVLTVLSTARAVIARTDKLSQTYWDQCELLPQERRMVFRNADGETREVWSYADPAAYYQLLAEEVFDPTSQATWPDICDFLRRVRDDFGIEEDTAYYQAVVFIAMKRYFDR